MFDLRQLECFIAAGEELNFRRAAARLNMTQPPLSRQIRLLEYELHLELFARTSRSVRLTPAGAIFLREARRIVALAGNAASTAQRIARGGAGLIKLGFTPGSSYRFVPRLLAHINACMKSIDVELHEMSTRDEADALQTGAIDLGVVRPSANVSRIQLLSVARERMILAVPRSHRLAKGPMPTIDGLGGEPFITFSPVDGPYFHGLVERIFQSRGVSTNYVQQVGQIHSILALVSAGQGVALVPESASILHFDRVVLRKIRTPEVFAELHLAWADDNPNPALQVFRKTALPQLISSLKETEPPHTPGILIAD